MATFSAADPPEPRAALIAAILASNPSCPNGTFLDAMFWLWLFACSQMTWFFASAGFPMLLRWSLTSVRIASSYVGAGGVGAGGVGVGGVGAGGVGAGGAGAGGVGVGGVGVGVAFFATEKFSADTAPATSVTRWSVSL